MRWVKLSDAVLPAGVVQAVGMFLDVPADLITAVWQQIRTNTAYRSFRLHLDREREIHVPNEALRELQLHFLTRILYTGPVSPAAFAGVPGRSLVAAARRHFDRPQGQVVAFDIRDAYGTTTYTQVVVALRQRLRREMWVLGLSNEEQAQVLGLLAYFLTVRRQATHGRRLPLGAPTSVALFNLVCLELDGALFRNLTGERYQGMSPYYTRYVDDLVFSGSKPFRKEFLTEVANTVSRHGFRINDDKTRRMQLKKATIYGLQSVEKTIVPGREVRERLARHITEHVQTVRSDRSAPRRKLRSRDALRAIDGYLRQFYESAGIERPPPLRFNVPPPEAQALNHLDLLWE